MHCIKCGVEFHELDILSMDEGEIPTCDDCDLKEMEETED